MSLEKIAELGRSVMITEHIALRLLRTCFGVDDPNAVGWAHRVTHANNWKNDGDDPMIKLVGSAFVRKGDAVEFNDVSIMVGLQIEKIPVAGSVTSNRHHVKTIEIRFRYSKNLPMAVRRFRITKRDTHALPAGVYDLIEIHG